MRPPATEGLLGSAEPDDRDSHAQRTQQTVDTNAYLGHARFNQSFTLPPSPGRPEPFNVTYSDYGYHNPTDPEQENVVLFCGPLFSSRFLHVAKDELAKKYRIRIINPDRPGIGGTTEVEAHRRLSVWLEIVPALMQHIGVKHFSLVCQSAGTLYALHTLLHLRHLLRPERPYVAFCGPWVHPTHSGVSLLSWSTALPPAILSRFDSVASFVNSKIVPAVGFSSGFLSSLTPSRLQRKPVLAEGVDARMVEFEENIMPHAVKRAHGEDIRGMSQEVLLLLRKSGKGPAADDQVWGTWDDVDKFVPLLAALEEQRATSENSGHPALEVDAFFAESDIMIGETAGPKWFDDCWSSEHRGEIRYQSQVIPGSDHDHILDLKFDVAEKIFQKISGINDSNIE